MIALAFMGIGSQELILIALIVVVLFGATKLPKLASSIGESVKNFKRGMREAEEEEQKAKLLQNQAQPKALASEETADAASEQTQT